MYQSESAFQQEEEVKIVKHCHLFSHQDILVIYWHHLKQFSQHTICIKIIRLAKHTVAFQVNDISEHEDE